MPLESDPNARPGAADISTRDAVKRVLDLSTGSRRLLAGTAAFSSLNAGATIALPMLLPLYLLGLASGAGIVPMFGIGAAMVAKWIGLAGAGHCSIELGTRTGVEGRKKVSRHAARLLGETTELSVADITQASQESVPTLRAQLLNTLREVMTLGATVIGGAAAFGLLFVPIGGAAVIGAPIWLSALGLTGLASVFVGTSMVRKLRSLEIEEQEAALEISKRQQDLNEETVSFLRSVGREQEPAEALDEPTDRWGQIRRTLNLRQMYVHVAQGSFGEFLTFGLPAAVVLLGIAGAPFLPLITAVGLALNLCSAAMLAPWRLEELTSTFRSAARSVARVVDAQPVRTDRTNAIRFERDTSATPKVSLDEVTYRHGNNPARALDGLSLEFPTTGMFAVTGINGAGKSTLLKVAADYYDPESGRVLLDGIDRLEYALNSRRIGIMVSQDAVLYGTTIGEALRLEKPSRLTEREISDMLKQVGLDKLLEPYGKLPWHQRPTTQVSGGERQRLALAAAALVRDAALFLDEPLNHLGPVEVGRVMRTLGTVSKNRPVVMATHNLDVVYHMALPGVYVEFGRVKERWVDPTTLPATSRFVSTLAIMPWFNNEYQERLKKPAPPLFPRETQLPRHGVTVSTAPNSKPPTTTSPCQQITPTHSYPPLQVKFEIPTKVAASLKREGWPDLPTKYTTQLPVKVGLASKEQLLAGAAAILADKELRAVIGLSDVDKVSPRLLETIAVDLGKLYWSYREYGGPERDDMIVHFQNMTRGPDFRKVFFRHTPALANAVQRQNGWDPYTFDSPDAPPVICGDVTVKNIYAHRRYQVPGTSVNPRLSNSTPSSLSD